MQSVVTLEVKPWDDETDMAALEKAVRSIEQEGLVWGSSKLVAVGYGIKKLQITLVIEDELVSLDELQEKLAEFEDYVQSSDVAAMQSEFHPSEYDPTRYTETTGFHQSCKHARLKRTRVVSGGYRFPRRCNKVVNILVLECHGGMNNSPWRHLGIVYLWQQIWAYLQSGFGAFLPPGEVTTERRI